MGKLIFSISLLLLLLDCCHGGKVGVCYGRSADDLPTPSKVVQLIKQHNIKYVRIYDYNSQVLKAFANTTIELMIGVPNSDLKPFSQSQPNVDTWLKNSVLPHYPTTKITYITVGAESTDDPHTTNASSLVVPAMQNVLTALKKVGLSRRIKVSTTLSLGVLSRSFPPSAGAFNSSYAYFLRPMLEFLAENQSPFMVDLYPYYAYRDSPNNVSLDYVLFDSSSEVIDPNTGLLYKNMFDAQVDAIYYALAALNFRTIKIMVTETGWPTKGSPKEKGAASPDNAEKYNSNIIHHTVTNQGTPSKPGEAMDVYIFSLFNENKKTGLDSERNWGLFYPDQTSVYQLDLTGKNSGLFRANSSSNGRSESWCIASSKASEIELRGALDWACGPGNVDCTAIQPSQACFQPDTLVSHASFVFNSYFQQNGGTDVACSFGGVGVKVNKDPSYDKCIYVTAGGYVIKDRNFANSDHIFTDVVEIFDRNNTKAANTSALTSSASTSHGHESLVWNLSLWLVISLLLTFKSTNSPAL